MTMVNAMAVGGAPTFEALPRDLGAQSATTFGEALQDAGWEARRLLPSFVTLPATQSLLQGPEEGHLEELAGEIVAVSAAISMVPAISIFLPVQGQQFVTLNDDEANIVSTQQGVVSEGISDDDLPAYPDIEKAVYSLRSGDGRPPYTADAGDFSSQAKPPLLLASDSSAVAATGGASNAMAPGANIRSIILETHHASCVSSAKLDLDLHKVSRDMQSVAETTAISEDRQVTPIGYNADIYDVIASARSAPENFASPCMQVADAIELAIRTQAQSRLEPSSSAMPQQVSGAPVLGMQAAGTASAGEAAKSLRIKLHPAHLGEVDVHLSMRGTSLRVQLRAETPEAKQALKSTFFELRETLSMYGLKLEGLAVDLIPNIPPDAVWPQSAVQSPSNDVDFDRQHRDPRRGNHHGEPSVRSKTSPKLASSAITHAGLFV